MLTGLTRLRNAFDSPESIDVFEGELYFMSQASGAVYKVDKFGRGLVKEVVGAGSVTAGTDLKVRFLLRWLKHEG